MVSFFCFFTYFTRSNRQNIQQWWASLIPCHNFIMIINCLWVIFCFFFCFFLGFRSFDPTNDVQKVFIYARDINDRFKRWKSNREKRWRKTNQQQKYRRNGINKADENFSIARKKIIPKTKITVWTNWAKYVRTRKKSTTIIEAKTCCMSVRW